MAVPDFKLAFATVEVAYLHDNWRRSSTSQTGAGKSWNFVFSTIRDQEIFLTFDTFSQRLTPPGCA